MKLKTILIVLAIGICAASIDSLAVMYDIEPDEPGGHSFGAFVGAVCGLLDIPIIFARTFLWLLFAKIFFRYPLHTMRVIYDHQYPFMWATDLIIVFVTVGIALGIRHLWRLISRKQN